MNLKGTPNEDSRRHENVENLKMFTFADFVWWFCQYVCKRFFFFPRFVRLEWQKLVKPRKLRLNVLYSCFLFRGLPLNSIVQALWNNVMWVNLECMQLTSCIVTFIVNDNCQSPWAHLHVVGMLQFMSNINQPSLPTPFYSVLVSISVFMALSTVFHSINSPINSPFCDSVLPVSSLPYWSFQLYISLRKSPSVLI